MARYIELNTLVEYIEALFNDEFQCNSYDEATGFQNALTLVKKFIDIHKVKEVDLEKEIDFAMPSKYCWSGDGEAVYSKE